MYLIYCNARFNQLNGVDHQSNFLKKIFFLSFLIMIFHIIIKSFFVLARNHIPSLCFPNMIVIYGIQEKVLHMPTKCSKLHTHIHPGNSNSTYLLFFIINNSQQRSWRFVEIVEIKQVFLILKISVQPVMHLTSWKPTPIE